MKVTPLSILSLVAGPIAFLSQPAAANYKRCINEAEVDYDFDYFPNKISPKYSANWDITYHKTYKIITNAATDTSYLLYQCGTEPPSSEVDKHTLSFSVPLQDGLVLSSTTMIPHIDQLGIRRQVHGYMGDPAIVSSPCLKTLIVDAEAIETVYESTSWYKQGTLLEDFFVSRPDAIVLRSYSGGKNTFVMSEYTEEESLDIYEWHKVYGALFNLEETANEQFDAAESRFNCNSDNAAYIAEQRRLDGIEETPPVVVWASWSNYSEPNYWDVARCDEKNLYYCEFAQRCGATLLHSNEGTIANPWGVEDYHMTDEEFFEFAKDADHWIYTAGNFDYVYNKFGDDLDKFTSVKNKEVYDTQGSGSNAWFEQRIAEFDIVLQDFCDVVGHYDETNSPPHQRGYFRKVMPVGEEPVPLPETCGGGFVDLPWESRASQCVSLSGTGTGTGTKGEKEKPSSAAVNLSLGLAIFAGLASSFVLFLA